ncbi:hypothetical protein [Photobacterium sanguinicancri]|uniref:hypothetical protein n=1 Tax=Photobacterium sanguinicancri TaxID=875932 RepID=UPI00113FECE9|nr:hypothetical protein [Photobacterium sanguinicancri]MDO6496574.1 hypothetical protein [Photobacterium sanguinicancri]
MIGQSPRALNPDIVQHKCAYDEVMSFRETMINDHTDGYIILKDGKVLREGYLGDFTAYKKAQQNAGLSDSKLLLDIRLKVV